MARLKKVFKNLKITYGKAFNVDNIELEEANNKLYKQVEKLLKQNSKH